MPQTGDSAGSDGAPGRLELGKRGEDLACAHLRQAGLHILARNHRTRFGELDAVARDGGILVFVEVKTRRSHRCGTGAEAVTPAKQARIRRMAEAYLAAHPDPPPCRFDVVEVRWKPSGQAAVRHIRDAF